MCIERRTYLYLHLGEINYASAKFICNNLDSFLPFYFSAIAVLRDCNLPSSINFYGEGLAKFESYNKSNILWHEVMKKFRARIGQIRINGTYAHTYMWI